MGQCAPCVAPTQKPRPALRKLCTDPDCPAVKARSKHFVGTCHKELTVIKHKDAMGAAAQVHQTKRQEYEQRVQKRADRQIQKRADRQIQILYLGETEERELRKVDRELRKIAAIERRIEAGEKVDVLQRKKVESKLALESSAVKMKVKAGWRCRDIDSKPVSSAASTADTDDAEDAMA